MTCPRPWRWPITLWLGALIIVLCEGLLFYDVQQRGGVVAPLAPGVELVEPQGFWPAAARYVAINITALCWLAYLLLLDGLLTLLGRCRGEGSLSPLRRRPNRYVIAWLTSIPVWCFFDWVNFYYIDAWRYHGLPEHFGDRVLGYFIAFAAISPGMFLAAELLQRLGFARLRSRGVRIGKAAQIACLLLGVVMFVYPLLVRDPIGSLTLWVSVLFLFDPINYWLGQPSIIGDWRQGRWGRTLALMAGGAICGFLWEFWNYWALAKWTYHLPFLGRLEHYRYFEMPWLGFLGFLPFAIECWVLLNLILALFQLCRLPVAEELPDDHAIL